MRQCQKFVGVFFIIILVSIKFSYDSEIFSNNLVQRQCGRFPLPSQIFTDNVIWQVLESPFGFIYLLNAYLDQRWNKTEVKVNINAPKTLVKKNHKLFCQFWFAGETQPFVVQASQFQSMYILRLHGKLKRVPYLVSCPIEFNKKLPVSVSLTLNSCDNAENNLEIINNLPIDGVKKEFGVCVKQLTYPDRSFIIKFIEWVETLKVLGADKIYFYNRLVHNDLVKVVEHLEAQGIVDMKPFLEPSGVSNSKADRHAMSLEVAVVNDCFYRIRNLYKYVVILDPDEVIMPLYDRTWHDLLQNLNASFETFMAREVLYPKPHTMKVEGVPDYFYMLQHVFKSFVVADNVTLVYNHGALLCGDRECKNYRIPWNLSHVNHYREQVFNYTSNVTEKDVRIWRYKDEIIKAVNETLQATHFVP